LDGVTFSEVGGLGCTNALTPVGHVMVMYGHMTRAGGFRNPPNSPVTPPWSKPTAVWCANRAVVVCKSGEHCILWIEIFFVACIHMLNRVSDNWPEMCA